MNGVPLLFALVTVIGVADRQGAPPVADSPFVGEWTANLAKSKQDPNHQFQRVTLRIAVAGETATTAKR